MNKLVFTLILLSAATVVGIWSCRTANEWNPPTVSGPAEGTRVVTVTAEMLATGRVWKGHNFRYGPRNTWLLDSDNSATDHCATGVTWDFPLVKNRSWKDLGMGAGMCGPLH